MGTTLNTSGYMLRKGRWKYVVNYPAQLFDIENDPGELNDLRDREPETVKQLDTDQLPRFVGSKWSD